MKDKDTVLLEEAYSSITSKRDFTRFFTPEEINVLNAFVEGKVDLSTYPELEQKLYDYFGNEMPYGIQKARTGDPYDWFMSKLEYILPTIKRPGSGFRPGETCISRGEEHNFQPYPLDNSILRCRKCGEFANKPLK
jgi:hypothetical protein